MVKNYLILLMFLNAFFSSFGQVVTMSTGGWRTSSSNTYTKITGSTNLLTKIYRIDCTTLSDASILQFRIIVDGKPIQATFQEGSYIVVEGKDIAIEQVSQGTMVKGTWAILQQPEILATSIRWNYYTSLTSELLVASLKVEQEFLISINPTTPNCSNNSFTLIIDGQPVKDSNNTILKFLEGSTVYAKGKNILLHAIGTCTNNFPIVGDIKLAKLIN